jgi:hypothetical protein
MERLAGKLLEEIAMRRHVFPVTNHLWFGWALVYLVVAGAAPLTAFGAERIVIGEECTATW